MNQHQRPHQSHDDDVPGLWLAGRGAKNLPGRLGLTSTAERGGQGEKICMPRLTTSEYDAWDA